MTCSKCGTSIAAKALICYKCGTATTTPRHQAVAVATPRRWVRPLAIVVVIVVSTLGWCAGLLGVG